MHAQTDTKNHRHIHAHMHTCTHAHTHACACVRAHARTHARMHAHTNQSYYISHMWHSSSWCCSKVQHLSTWLDMNLAHTIQCGCCQLATKWIPHPILNLCSFCSLYHQIQIHGRLELTYKMCPSEFLCLPLVIKVVRELDWDQCMMYQGYGP